MGLKQVCCCYNKLVLVVDVHQMYLVHAEDFAEELEKLGVVRCEYSAAVGAGFEARAVVDFVVDLQRNPWRLGREED